jgi:hypothetical protein
VPFPGLVVKSLGFPIPTLRVITAESVERELFGAAVQSIFSSHADGLALWKIDFAIIALEIHATANEFSSFCGL